MKNHCGLIAGSVLSAALTLAACAQQAPMAESGMTEGQKLRTESGMTAHDGNMKMDAGMMEKVGNMKMDGGMMEKAGNMKMDGEMMEKAGNMKKDQMKEQNKNDM